MLNNLKISLFLANRSIAKGNKGTLILTIFIMALVFINLLLISSILLGIIDLTDNQVINTLYGNIVIEPRKDEKYINDVQSLKQKINNVPGVTGVSAHYVVGAELSYKNKSGAWSVRSIIPADEMTVTTTHNFMVDGEYLSKQDTDEIMLGKEIPGGYGGDLEYLSLGGVKVGDRIDVRFNNGVKRIYRVKGVFDVSFEQSDSTAYLSQREMESVLGLEDRASHILIKTAGKGNEDQYIKQFLELGIKEDIKSWRVYAGFVKSLTQSFSIINTLFAGIGLFVASVTIFIIIYVSTISKRRHIGILRAIGIKESIVIQSYIFQAMFFAISGIIFGFLILFLVLKPYFIAHPLKFPTGLVSLSITSESISVNAVSIIITALISGLIPSWLSVHATILEAIWGD
ncbi:MAG TPA: FtsX-like permease family protein [Candidatus Methanoperedens sp.]